MIFYAVFFLCLGFALVILEVLLPSGGLISIFAGLALIASLVLAFQENAGMGFSFLIAQMVALPILMIIGFSILPKTFIGRKIILSPAPEDDKSRGSAGVSEEDYTSLIGKKGKAVSDLRPSGTVEINDRRYSVVTKGEMIDAGEDIIVSHVEGNRIVVAKS